MSLPEREAGARHGAAGAGGSGFSRAARAGQAAAFAGLFDRYAPAVRRLVTRMLSDAAEADDLTQETLLIVVRRAHDIHSPEALRPFVMGVAVRTAKGELRRRSVRRWVGLDEARLTANAHDAVAGEQFARLQNALWRLGANGRALFLLRHAEQMDLAELAGAFRCSLATIKRRLAKVDKRFKALARADDALRDLVGGRP